MKSYAATDEYGNIIPLTIRNNADDCATAAITYMQLGLCEKSMPVTTASDLDKYGICIAEFEDASILSSDPITASQAYNATCTYVKGFRTGQVVQSQAAKDKATNDAKANTPV